MFFKKYDVEIPMNILHFYCKKKKDISHVVNF